MKTNRVLALAALLLGSLLGTSQTASGAALTVNGIGLGSYPVPLLTNHGSGLAPENAYVVQILITLNGSAATAFCLDLFTNIGLQNYNALYGSPADYINGNRAAWVVDTYTPGLDTNAEAAALQLALWDIIHDNGDGLTAGSIQLVATGWETLVADTQAIVTASLGQSSTNATILYTTALNGTPAQTLITRGVLVDVPEPATWALLAAGGAFIAAHRRPSSAKKV
ncbi:MAG: PEP-CTERM sorting domain-containing protein [Bryobacterales bacterium]|nr:PEP-CTERM sorting domain-containing protein [Bryobacterales bacterium]